VVDDMFVWMLSGVAAFCLVVGRRSCSLWAWLSTKIPGEGFLNAGSRVGKGYENARATNVMCVLGLVAAFLSICVDIWMLPEIVVHRPNVGATRSLQTGYRNKHTNGRR
jgi:hypothetical protein